MIWRMKLCHLHATALISDNLFYSAAKFGIRCLLCFLLQIKLIFRDSEEEEILIELNIRYLLLLWSEGRHLESKNYFAMMANFEFKSNGNQPGLENCKKPKNNDFIQCEEGPGVVAYLLTLGRLSNTTLLLWWNCRAWHYMAPDIIIKLWTILYFITENKSKVKIYYFPVL